MSTDLDYYEILGVMQSASQDEIRHAYRVLARRYHPDSRDEEVATTLFHDVQMAYAILSDPNRRRAYDKRRTKAGRDDEALVSWNIQASQTQLYTGYEEQIAYVLVEIQPSTGVESKRLPLNLCLVVDRSTSMHGLRLEYVKGAAYQIIDDLNDGDVISIVSFSDRADVVVSSEPVKDRVKLKVRVAAMQAGGGTEILHGLEAGLSEIAVRHGDRVNSHLILLTDGQTYGDEDACLVAAERAGSDRIAITAMGMGEDWNDALLDEIANRSGGVSAYISSPDQVRALLQQRVRSAGMLFAQRLKLTMRRAENVSLERTFLISPVLRELEEVDGAIALGNMEADEPVVLMMELGIGTRPAGEHRLIQLELVAEVPASKQKNVRIERDLLFTFTSTMPRSSAVPVSLVNALSKVTLYQMQQQAWEALEEGDTERANRQLELVATRLLDIGEVQLARAAMLEAGRIAGGGGPTAKGRKEIRYGTRGLGVTDRRRSDD